MAAWLRIPETSQNLVPCGKGETKITRYTEIKSLAQSGESLRVSEKNAMRRRGTAGRQDPAPLGGGAEANRVGRAVLSAISLTRTWTDEPRLWPCPGMRGEANPQDRLNYLLTGKGRRKTYIMEWVQKTRKLRHKTQQTTHIIICSKSPLYISSRALGQNCAI